MNFTSVGYLRICNLGVLLWKTPYMLLFADHVEVLLLSWLWLEVEPKFLKCEFLLTLVYAVTYNFLCIVIGPPVKGGLSNLWNILGSSVSIVLKTQPNLYISFSNNVSCSFPCYFYQQSCFQIVTWLSAVLSPCHMPGMEYRWKRGPPIASHNISSPSQSVCISCAILIDFIVYLFM